MATVISGIGLFSFLLRTAAGFDFKPYRRVSCKDLGEGDYQGWLHRKRGKGEGPLAKHWLKRWCVLKEEKLFCYKDREDLKAESAIYLPAFDVWPAPEIKSRKYAFNIQNSGTNFVFASETEDDMSNWIENLHAAATHVTFSLGDDASDSEDEENPIEGEGTPPGSPVTDSEEDFTVMVRNISKAGVTFEGKDKAKSRRKTLETLDVGSLPLEDCVNGIKRLQSLQRTLKAKEKELEDIERLLLQEPSINALRSFKQKYPEMKSD